MSNEDINVNNGMIFFFIIVIIVVLLFVGITLFMLNYTSAFMTIKKTLDQNCISNIDCNSNFCDPTLKVCRIGKDQYCTSSEQCGTSFPYCDPVDNVCISTPIGNLMDICTVGRGCKPDLVCDSSTFICKVPISGVCKVDAECMKGQGVKCVNSICTNTTSTQSKKNLFDSCSTNSECDSGQCASGNIYYHLKNKNSLSCNPTTDLVGEELEPIVFTNSVNVDNMYSAQVFHDPVNKILTLASTNTVLQNVSSYTITSTGRLVTLNPNQSTYIQSVMSVNGEPIYKLKNICISSTNLPMIRL